VELVIVAPWLVLAVVLALVQTPRHTTEVQVAAGAVVTAEAPAAVLIPRQRHLCLPTAVVEVEA
jgi:hypothetical protein